MAFNLSGTSRVRFTSVAILISVLLHLVLAVVLWYKPFGLLGGKQGSIDVDFIEPVDHARNDLETDGDQPKKKIPTQENLAKPSSAAEVPGDPSVIAQATEVYIREVTKLIAERKIYPREAVEREYEGKVMVSVTLDRSGAVQQVEIEQDCPFALLNEAALKTVRSVGKFPPLPDNVQAPLHLHIPLVFKIL